MSKTRLEKLCIFIEENLEVDYGYLPMFEMKDETSVDIYIENIKSDFAELYNTGSLKKDSLNETIDILSKLDEI